MNLRTLEEEVIWIAVFRVSVCQLNQHFSLHCMFYRQGPSHFESRNGPQPGLDDSG